MIRKFEQYNESLRDKMTPKSDEDIKQSIGEDNYNAFINFKDEIKKIEKEFDVIVNSEVSQTGLLQPPSGRLFSKRYIYDIKFKNSDWVLNISNNVIGLHTIPFQHVIYKEWDSLINGLKYEITKKRFNPQKNQWE